jgi:hypothetical protein
MRRTPEHRAQDHVALHVDPDDDHAPLNRAPVGFDDQSIRKGFIRFERLVDDAFSVTS